MKVVAFIFAFNVAFVLYRAWAGGMVETGLERVLGFTEAQDE